MQIFAKWKLEKSKIFGKTGPKMVAENKRFLATMEGSWHSWKQVVRTWQHIAGLDWVNVTVIHCPFFNNSKQPAKLDGNLPFNLYGMSHHLKTCNSVSNS